MVWSKTTSSGNRVSAGIAVHVLGHTEPQGHRRDLTFHWITGLRPHWPLCRYPVTNLLALTSTQSNGAARPASRLGFALRHRVNPAQLAALGKKKGGKRREEWMDGGESRESNLEGWSGDREQCGRAWSLNSCGLGRFSLLGESDPKEQRLCGRVERVTKGQEMQTFFRGRKNTKATRWEVLVVYGAIMSSSIKTALISKQK